MADDLELGPVGERQFERRNTWRDKFSSRRLSTHLSYTPTSKLTNPFGTQLFAHLPQLSDEESRAEEALTTFMVGDQPLKRSLRTACNWYSRYLQWKVNNHWHQLRLTLVGLDALSTMPRPGDFVIVYKFLNLVAELMKSRENLALVDIVDKLDNVRLLKPQGDEERALANQITFSACGWLSMLYDAVSHPRADKLEVGKMSTRSCGTRDILMTRIYFNFRQGFDHIDTPIYTLLGSFGDLIPATRIFPAPDHTASGVITVQDVCFSSLQQFAGLRIEWVSSLALHLELDSGKKTLKMFQFPSFCRMMIVQKENNLLSRIFNDNAANHCGDVNTPDIQTDKYFREILSSYRLIFGQDDKSWRAFLRSATTKEDSQIPADTTWASDPLLYILCGKSSSCAEALEVFDDIDASVEASTYTVHMEYPSLGKRLLELQEFSKQHPPHDLKTLFQDRRNVANWVTLWSNQLILVFATLTILFMILGLILQGWQIKLAQQQLQQGAQQGHS